MILDVPDPLDDITVQLNVGDVTEEGLVRAVIRFADWTVDLRLDEQDAALVITEMSIKPRTGPLPAEWVLSIQGERPMPTGGITSSTLRDIPVGSILTQVRIELQRIQSTLVEALPTSNALHTEVEKRVAVTRGQLPTRGRKGAGDDFYRRIALEYLRLQNEGFGRGLLAELARRESKAAGREVPRETVRDWIHQARKREFLSKGTPGRAGADPGPRLYESPANNTGGR